MYGIPSPMRDGTWGFFFKLGLLMRCRGTDCGIGTLCMVLNALKIDPAKTWRKPWRWFTQG